MRRCRDVRVRARARVDDEAKRRRSARRAHVAMREWNRGCRAQIRSGIEGVREIRSGIEGVRKIRSGTECVADTSDSECRGG